MLDRELLNKYLSVRKYKAIKKGVHFDITMDDIEVPTVCPLLGIPLSHSKGQQSDSSPTFDRIIPELGYVPGNVLIISDRANRMKSNASLEEIQLLAINLQSIYLQALRGIDE